MPTPLQNTISISNTDKNNYITPYMKRSSTEESEDSFYSCEECEVCTDRSCAACTEYTDEKKSDTKSLTPIVTLPMSNQVKIKDEGLSGTYKDFFKGWWGNLASTRFQWVGAIWAIVSVFPAIFVGAYTLYKQYTEVRPQNNDIVNNNLTLTSYKMMSNAGLISENKVVAEHELEGTDKNKVVNEKGCIVGSTVMLEQPVDDDEWDVRYTTDRWTDDNGVQRREVEYGNGKPQKEYDYLNPCNF